jgi:hypothetical protein
MKLYDDLWNVIYDEYLDPKNIFKTEVLPELLSIYRVGWEPTVRTTKFLKRIRVVPRLERFMHLQPYETVTRPEIATYICEYIKSNNLVNLFDRRKVKPNDSFCELFSLTTTDEFTYLMMQKYIQSLLILF